MPVELTLFASSGTLEGTERANIIGDPFAGTNHTFVKGQSLLWFTPAAFVNPPNGSFGTMQKNSLYGPGFAAVDVSVFRNIPIKERAKFQLRFEFFNVFNHTNLNNPVQTLGSPAFGQILSTRTNSRQIQFAAKLYF